MAAKPAIAPNHWRRLARKAARLVLALTATSTIALAGGFGWFVYDARRSPPDTLPHADGIVALTGGTGRIEASLRLLAHDQGQQLLISGVASQTPLSALLPHSAPPGLAARVTPGYRAHSTIENAAETAAWVNATHIHSLIVVTAGYHMRRAVLELGRTLPDVILYPYPVIPPALQHPFRPATIKLLGMEYLKWLGALAGLAHRPQA